MATSRRAFLKSGAVASVFAGLYFSGSETVLGQPTPDQSGDSTNAPPADTRPAFEYKASVFEPHLGSVFKVRAGVKVTMLTLVNLKRIEPRAPEGKPVPQGENFSLLFRADNELSTVQTIYELDHESLGKFPLFVSRFMNENDREGIYYEAVINRAT